MQSAPSPTASQTEDIAPAPGLSRPAGRFEPAWSWQPAAIVFVSSACMMVLELVAGRIIAPYVGVSLYTWTSVIGVVLAGMSLGNYSGGRLADRYADSRSSASSRSNGGNPAGFRLLGVIFFGASLFSLAILALETLGLKLPDSWPVVVRILAFTAALFFVPSMILGGVSPVVVKLAVRDLARTGSTVGRISAAGTVGSIVGTFATGFWLISQFGTHIIVLGVAIILLIMALAFLLGGLRGTPRIIAGLLIGVALAGGAGLTITRGWLETQCTRESNYFCIKVHEEERDGEPVRILVLDRLVHSYTALNNPTKLVYGYEQVYAEVTAYQAQRADHLAALFIGGGGYTFPRYMEAVYPGSKLDVIEIDPGVTQVAYDLLGLSHNSPVVTYNEDARTFLAREPKTRYDLVLGDAFNDYSVPYHLTTQEFNERVRAWLAPGGLYMVNMIDGPRRDFLRAYVSTLRRTFAHVYVSPTVRTWRDSPRVTFVVVAGDAPLDLEALRSIDAGDGQTLFAEQMLSSADLDALLAEGRAVTLTDRYAPVDQMLAPVFRGEPAN